MQLDEVKGVLLQVTPGAVQPGPEVGQAVILGTLVHPPAHFCCHRDIQPGIGLEEGADDLFAPAVAIDISGVEEVHTGVDRSFQHG